MGLHYESAEMQPEASSDAKIMAVLFPVEHFKDVRKLGWVYARSFVLHLDEQGRFVRKAGSEGRLRFGRRAGRQSDDPVRWRIFQRVVQEIDPDPLEPAPIAGDHHI